MVTKQCDREGTGGRGSSGERGAGGGIMENERARERDRYEFAHGGGAGQKEIA